MTTGTTAKYAKQAKKKTVKLLHLFADLVCFAVVHLHDSTHRQSYETAAFRRKLNRKLEAYPAARYFRGAKGDYP